MVAQEFAMKSLIALLVFTCMATAQPQAAPDAPSTDQQVLELFQLMHIREQTLAVLQSSKEQIKATNRNMLESRLPNIKPAQLAELDAIVDDLYAHYPVDRVLQDMVPVYQRHLNKSDIEAVTAFYSSPAGQKLLREMPAMTAEAMQAASASMQKDTEEIMQKLEARIQELARQHRTERLRQSPNSKPPLPPK
jgi:uncharacterized protein